jgi:hypothetical protein
LSGYRDAYADAWSNLEALAKKFEQEQVQLSTERKQAQDSWAAFKRDTGARLDEQERLQEEFAREVKELARGAALNVHKGAEAAVQAASDSRKAAAVAAETKAKHYDIQAALKAIRTADTNAQKDIRKLSAEGRAQLQRVIKDQKEVLESFSRRTSQQGDVLLGDAQKLLAKANAMAANQLQAEENLRREVESFKDTIIGLVSKILGK